MSDPLIPDVDPTRTPWCFLSIDKSVAEHSINGTQSQIVGWQVGDGNSTQLVKLTTYSEDFKGEDVLETLTSELSARQYDEKLLLTPSRGTVKLLRTRLAQCHLYKESLANTGQAKREKHPRPSLHGFRFLPLKETLQRYFVNPTRLLEETVSVDGVSLSWEQDEQWSPTTMWQISRSVLPLIPIEVTIGEAL